jgi:hypothetical protein
LITFLQVSSAEQRQDVFRGKHPIPPGLSSNSVRTMTGIWLAALVAAFVGAGVVAQLGWELRPTPAVRKVFRRGKDTHRDTPRGVGGPP